GHAPARPHLGRGNSRRHGGHRGGRVDVRAGPVRARSSAPARRGHRPHSPPASRPLHGRLRAAAGRPRTRSGAPHGLIRAAVRSFRLPPPGKGVPDDATGGGPMIGIVMMLLGLATAGVLADAAVENASTGSGHAVDLFGQTLHPSTLQLAVAGAILGAATVVLIGTGLALLLGRRRNRRAAAPDRAELERRVEQLAARSRLLESQNSALTQENSALRQQAEDLEDRSGGPGA